MRRYNEKRRSAGRLLGLMLLGLAAPWAMDARAQELGVVGSEPGRAVAGVPDDGIPVLPAEVQVVRIQGPTGLGIEVLDPAPMPVTVPADALMEGGITVGLQVGVPYRLRLSNLPNRPDAELFPIVELVGHLHRPPNIDPTRYPIRLRFTQDDLDDVIELGRLVTQVVYLEAPEQAIPLKLEKDELLTVNLSPAEDPVKVARALGRVMAIVRLGGRTPAPGESLGLPGLILEAGPCPFASPHPDGGRCGVPSCVTLCPAPPAVASGPTLPRDEYLCDGGDHQSPVGRGMDGRLSGVDPKDSVVQFQIDEKMRVLPTNTVCIFAPRFAAVRLSVGPTQTQIVQTARNAEKVEGQITTTVRQPPMRLTLNQAAEAARHRARASGLNNRVGTRGHFEIRVLTGATQIQAIQRRGQTLQPGMTGRGELPAAARIGEGPVRLKTAEGTLVTGLVESGGQTIMSWKPQEIAGVEVPPNKPGLAVIKQVDVDQAQPGDRAHYTIRYKNIGNVPIYNVAIVDSLLPRLEYVEGSAEGPAGAVFSAAENRLGSVELRWDLPGPVAPGEEGSVRFEVVVR